MSNSVKLIILVLLAFLIIPVSSQNEPVTIVPVKEKTIIDGKAYYLHPVKSGETLFSICKAYNVSQNEVVAINSIVNNSIKVGQTLKIPAETVLVKNLPESESFIFHIVESGQTVFSISQKYNLTREQLFKYNPELEVSPIQVGQVIKIPKNVSGDLPPVKPQSTASYISHKVKKKDTLYSLSRQYQISVDEIIAANPELNTNDIQVGETIKIPTFSKEQIVQPAVIKPDTSKEVDDNTALQPCTPQSGNTVYKVAFLLPLYLEEDKTVRELDSLKSASGKNTEDKIYAKSVGMLEFYEGALLAIDSLKSLGYSFKIHVYDTGRDLLRINTILAKPELKDMDLFIGPLDSLLIEKVLPFAKAHNIKVVSPLSQNTNLLKGNPELFQVNPSESSKIEGAIQYISKQTDKNVILIKTNKPSDKEIYGLFEEKLNLLRTQGFQFTVHSGNQEGILKSKLSKDKENFIIIPSVDDSYVPIMVNNSLNQLANAYNITVFGPSQWNRYKIENSYLHNIQFEYYTAFYADYTKPLLHNYLAKNRTNFNYEPEFGKNNSFSSQGYAFCFLGYDITFYFLNALAHYGRNFDNCLPTYVVDLIQSDFHFMPPANGNGSMNRTINIIRYNKDFTITKIH